MKPKLRARPWSFRTPFARGWNFGPRCREVSGREDSVHAVAACVAAAAGNLTDNARRPTLWRRHRAKARIRAHAIRPRRERTSFLKKASVTRAKKAAVVPTA